MEGYIGEVRMFAGTFAPRNWAFCQGQLLAIQSNTALFSILGTQFGGDGRTTFALPDLRSRIPLGPGDGPGLTPRSQGEKGGTEHFTLTTSQMAAHTHTVEAQSQTANVQSPVNNIWATELTGATAVYSTKNPNGFMSPLAITSTGGSQPFYITEPVLGLYYIICLTGIFPSRN